MSSEIDGAIPDQHLQESSKPDPHHSEVTSGESSWDDDGRPPLDLNYDALQHIASCYLPGNHGDCVNVGKLQWGAFNEIRLLEFEDQWSCIARFTCGRDQHVHVAENTYATMKYVRERTTIPVPEVYFTNLDPTNAVGAPFALMERKHGKTYYELWHDVSLNHKLAIVEQIADVLAQLADLQFNQIGSLNANGELSPLLCPAIPLAEVSRGPFDTTEAWMLSFIAPTGIKSPELQCHYEAIRVRIKEHRASQSSNAIYNPPFRLQYYDFEGQNLLFDWPDPALPPKLSGVINWDHAFTGPLYYLYEYPIFIQDVDWSPELYDDNKILRKHFILTLLRRCEKGSSARDDVRECFRQKSYLYNKFMDLFLGSVMEEEHELSTVEWYRKGIDATGGKEGWIGLKENVARGDKEGSTEGDSDRVEKEDDSQDEEDSEDDGDGTYYPYGGTGSWKADSEVESEGED